MYQNLKPYPEYKDSGVPWLAEVPEHWEKLKLRSMLRRVTERNRPDLPLLSVVREKGVIQRDTSSMDENRNFIPDDLSNYKVVRTGQFAVNKMKAWQGSYGVSQYDGIVSPAYFVFGLTGVERQFFHLAIRSRAYVPFFTQASDGVRIGQWDLAEVRMREISFLVPPLPEQSAIVRFISHFERHINCLIRSKRRLIELLNEQKQAIISQYVTGKIDPRTGKPYPRYKPSGVEWLGDIPEHWEVKRLKAIAQIRYGLGQPPRETLTGLPLIRATNVDNGKILENNLVRVDPADVPKTRNAFLKAGEIIVVRSGALTADSAIIPKEYEGAVAGYDMVVNVKRARPEFVALALLTSYVQADQLIISSMRAAQPHLNAEELGTAILLLPPDGEQKQIVEFVRNVSLPIDNAIIHLERGITLLQEYRTRLIADVVTGKLDVRGVELPLLVQREVGEDTGAVEDIEMEEMINNDEATDGEEQ